MRIGKIKSKHVLKELRFSGGYFLNEDAVNSRLLEENADKCKPLKELANVFNPPIFKRQFCENTERAVPYCQSSDVTNALEGSDVYINKAQAIKVGAVVKDKQTLVTGFGTIGNTRLVNELSNGIAYANNVCRIETHDESIYGYIYALMTSKYGRAQLNKNASGSVVRYIEAPGIKETLVPILPEPKQQQIHNLIVEASKLRVEANKLLKENKSFLKNEVGLEELTNLDYEYFGNFSDGRPISAFKRSISEISALTINAFNYSKRVEVLEKRVKRKKYLRLSDCLDENQIFSTGSFKRLEIDSPTSIKLLNQSDIFNLRKEGKNLARKFVRSDKLVEYGEILIAGVGTLGEGETFCNVIFANEELEGQLIAGEFIRMKVNDNFLSGYLYCWLSTDYAFRFIRKTQTGTKLCRPIQELLKKIPVPLIDEDKMKKIDESIKKAQSMMYVALLKENQAINLIENEIEQWQES